MFEIAVLDEGIGIANSLRSNVYYKTLIKIDDKALALSWSSIYKGGYLIG